MTHAPLNVSPLSDMEAAVTLYEQSLHLAEDYLTGRGIDLEVARAYRLGVVAEPYSGHEKYRGRLAIPYLTKAGVVNIKFRTLPGDDGVKYLCLPGMKTKLYNVNAFFQVTDTVAVVEGEIDAMVATEYAGLPAVGVPGASNWNPMWNRLFSGIRRVLVVGDGDGAGEKFAEEVAEILDGTPVVLPNGRDCNSILVDEGEFGLMTALGV